MFITIKYIYIIECPLYHPLIRSFIDLLKSVQLNSYAQEVMSNYIIVTNLIIDDSENKLKHYIQ